MNFKGNSFSLPQGRVISAADKDGAAHIFIQNGGVICRTEFDPVLRGMKTSVASYADNCFLTDGGRLLEQRNGRTVYAQG